MGGDYTRHGYGGVRITGVHHGTGNHKNREDPLCTKHYDVYREYRDQDRKDTCVLELTFWWGILSTIMYIFLKNYRL